MLSTMMLSVTMLSAMMVVPGVAGPSSLTVSGMTFFFWMLFPGTLCSRSTLCCGGRGVEASITMMTANNNMMTDLILIFNLQR